MALTDEAGTVQATYTHEAFGASTIGGASSTNPYGYSGRESDSTGLYYYRARYCHSSVIRVQFCGVSNLSLREFGGGMTQVPDLNIEDIHERQWSNVVYRVTESERESISFLCSDVSILARYPLGNEPA